MTNIPITSEYKQTEIGVIPADWDFTNLGEKTIKIGSGKTPTGGVKVYKKFGRPLLRSQNIGWGVLKLEDVVFIDDIIHESFSSTEIKEKDVFLNITGASIGRCSVADKRVIGGNVNQHVCIIRTNKDELNPYYLKYFLLSNKGQKQIDSFQAGGNRQGLNFGQINSFKVIIPPTEIEQSAIATALSDIDSLVEKIGKLIEKKKNIKQGAMQELLTGKIRLPGFNDRWETKKLGNLLDYEQPTKYIVKSTEYSDKNNIPVLTAGKSFILGYTDEEFNIFKNLPVIIFDDFTTATQFVDFPFKVKSSAMKILKPKNKDVDLRFAFEKMQLIDFKLGDHKRYWISEYQNIEIETPKHEEQTAIANVLSDMNSEIEKLESQLSKYQNIKQGMMQTLLTGKIRLLKPLQNVTS